MRSNTKSYEVNDQQVKKVEEAEDDPALTSCGIGSWRPKWLQPLSSPLLFLVSFTK